MHLPQWAPRGCHDTIGCQQQDSQVFALYGYLNIYRANVRLCASCYCYRGWTEGGTCRWCRRCSASAARTQRIASQNTLMLILHGRRKPTSVLATASRAPCERLLRHTIPCPTQVYTIATAPRRHQRGIVITTVYTCDATLQYF
jgi:hypothetical protein